MTRSGATSTSPAVTGLGLVTPAGRGTQASWDAVLAGTPAAEPDPDLADAAGIPTIVTCRVRDPDLDPDPDGDVQATAPEPPSRPVRLALTAAREAVACLDRTLGDAGVRTAVVLGSCFADIADLERQHRRLLEDGDVDPHAAGVVSRPAASRLAAALGVSGPAITVNTSFASGASAVYVARQLLRARAVDVVLAGGTDVAITPCCVAAFGEMGALSSRCDATASRPFDADRDGFVLGEGAGILVLERLEDVAARGGTPLAVLAGAGASADAHHPTAPPDDGAGAVLAMQRALHDAGVAPSEVDLVNAHGTSTPLNDRVEAAAIRTVLGDGGGGAAVTSTKGVTGHLLGAAGAVEAAFAVLAIRDGVVPPTANLEHVDADIDLDVVKGTPRHGPVRVALTNSFGFGGQNAALLFVSP
ncbi:MAG: beta-ketoacyl-[acyl-carrier-protein] synthase family protein [Actinomycetota bacterium]|nr:beta-ketoacyl-[acyl-carrier-protein] synthase family protein [Actinomycetota bacterium]